MKKVQFIVLACLVGFTAACSQGFKDRLFGTDSSSESSSGNPGVENPSTDVALMQKVAADISAELSPSQPEGAVAISSGACVPGPITIKTSSYTIPNRVYGSSRQYVLNGVTYFTANNYYTTGGTLGYTYEYNGTCLSKFQINGGYSAEGSSYVHWYAGTGPVRFQYYYYTYKYTYTGNRLEIEGYYSLSTETGTTKYPIKVSIPIGQ
ncbi:MAG: hypothetical protein KBG07_05540 [Elusimicrobia bacterium]|nr:hypothetical protein [Elusimicrobiota bacterium]